MLSKGSKADKCRCRRLGKEETKAEREENLSSTVGTSTAVLPTKQFFFFFFVCCVFRAAFYPALLCRLKTLQERGGRRQKAEGRMQNAQQIPTTKELNSLMAPRSDNGSIATPRRGRIAVARHHSCDVVRKSRSDDMHVTPSPTQ